jgi:hypothetical protein
MLSRWIDLRSTLSSRNGNSRYETAYGPFRIDAYLPNDRLCWCLTFELILKTLDPADYRALAAWYRDQSEPSLTSSAVRAARKIVMESNIRDFY